MALDGLTVRGDVTVPGVLKGVDPALTRRLVMANDLRTTAKCCRE
jgi:hypothetical protein